MSFTALKVEEHKRIWPPAAASEITTGGIRRRKKNYSKEGNTRRGERGSGTHGM
jgi:hypothetical protein